MTIKALLLGSAAALMAVTGARAADAIVAAEPEQMEYVRVCDAFGTGYFYIPGTETCLKIGGYIRSEARFGRDESGTSDWSFWNRAQISFSAKSDTELGALTSQITLRGEVENSYDRNEFIDEAFIELAGFRVGYQYSWWDDDPSGETDSVASNSTNHNSVRYDFGNETFGGGISVDELEDDYDTKPGEGPNNIGVAAQLAGTAGIFSGFLLGGYDTDTEEAAIRAIVYADLGNAGKLGVYGVWASGVNYYYEESEWTVGAQYELKLNDKWAITPGAQYFKNVGLNAGNTGFGNADAWVAGATVDYKIVENLSSKLSVQYRHEDEQDDQVYGFMRLERKF